MAGTERAADEPQGGSTLKLYEPENCVTMCCMLYETRGLKLMATTSNFKHTLTDCDEFQMWQHTEAEIRKRLPFRNVQWRSTTGRQRVIDQLSVNLVPFDAAMVKPKPGDGLYDSPLLHLYMVSCDVCLGAQSC